MISGRALHFVFKIGNRARNAHFFRDVLGMKVLRHEEFQEGCDAQCNGPYDNRWSKTMVGYGPEANHFVIELTYNYGVKSYQLGNEFGGITIRSSAVLQRAKQHKWETKPGADGQTELKSPDGYTFFIVDEEQPAGSDPVVKTTLNCTNLANTIKYWHETLDMALVSKEDKTAVLSYKDHFQLAFNEISSKIDRATAYGRIAFAVPYDMQETIDKRVFETKGTVLTSLITLDTPGKATVRVIILADPDGHEICFVDEEGFGQLSAFEEKGNSDLDKYIAKDPFQ